MIVNKTELIVNASLLEDGLVEEVKEMIINNPRLFDDEKVVLMADTHKGNGVPVGFTMTLSKGLIPIDYVSADMFCGVSCMVIRDRVLSERELKSFSYLVRDLIQVNRRYDFEEGELTDYGTLGNGNHFLEIGTNGKDTMISVHSGSRNIGGEMFKKHKNIAIEQTKMFYNQERKEKLKEIEPKLREEYLNSLPKISNLPLLNINKYPQYIRELKETRYFAEQNRLFILYAVKNTLFVNNCGGFEILDCVHNFVDFIGKVPILRKGAIKAEKGKTVIIPINMKDGIIVGVVKNDKIPNNSLPHGAGRVMSRTQAFNDLKLEDYEKDMENVISVTVNQATLDEAPSVYKPLATILSDIEPYLSSYEIFKSQFNYKGV